MRSIRFNRATMNAIGVGTLMALIPVSAVVMRIANPIDARDRHDARWVTPEAVHLQLAATKQNAGHNITSVTHREVKTFTFTFPCISGGNPYSVTTTSDATVTLSRTEQTDSRHTETFIGFTDVGTYKAISKGGGRPLAGSFFDSSTAVARDGRIDSTGTVLAARHLSNSRVLALTTGATDQLFRENIAVDTENYNATVTAPTSDHVTCARNPHRRS